MWSGVVWCGVVVLLCCCVVGCTVLKFLYCTIRGGTVLLLYWIEWNWGAQTAAGARRGSHLTGHIGRLTL